MAWVRIHDDALSHPKLFPLFDARDPLHLWVWGLTYAQRHLTDGFISDDVLPRGGQKSAEILKSRGLWTRCENGYEIHDYLDWNDSRETVRSKQDKAKSRQRRWTDARSQRASQRVERRVSNAVSNGEPNLTKPNHYKESPSDSLTRERLAFEAFWSAYPRKVGKDAAWKAFIKRKPDELTCAAIVLAVDRQAQSEQWRRDGGQFIPHPATWLNQGRWKDETSAVQSRHVGGGRRWQWEDCPHEPHCGNQTTCQHKLDVEAFKAGRAS